MVEDGGEEGVEFGGGFGLEGFEAADFGFKFPPVQSYLIGLQRGDARLGL